jgi:hypothetical protein
MREGLYCLCLPSLFNAINITFQVNYLKKNLFLAYCASHIECMEIQDCGEQLAVLLHVLEYVNTYHFVVHRFSQAFTHYLFNL